MTRLLDTIIKHTNQDLDAVKKMQKQIDNAMAQHTHFVDKDACSQYRKMVATKQKLFKRTNNK